MKVKTLKDNVLTLNKKGTTLEVSEEEAKRLIELGVAEEVKQPKKQAPKKKPSQKKEEGDK